jgi:DNA-3-methyladenine glycosylase II
MENNPFDRMEEFSGQSLDNPSGVRACTALATQSNILENLLQKNGIPPLWSRDPGFESLVRIILEQAVSLESAKAVFEKCQKEIGMISPKSIWAADEKVLRNAGFSRMKLMTCRLSAEKVLTGEINLFPANPKEDIELAENLIRLPGIGQWTIDIYFLLALKRDDIWPLTDRALIVAVSKVLGLNDAINRADLMHVAEPWHPFRSWAARIFWHDYLIRRNRLAL